MPIIFSVFNFSIGVNVLSRLYLRLARYWSYSVKNPAWLLMFLLARFDAIRNLVRSWYPAENLDRYREADSVFKELNVERVVAQMQEQGYALGLNLPPDIFRELIEIAYSSKIQARNYPDLNFVYGNKPVAADNNFVHGTYPNIRSHPAVQKLENDPKLLKIAARYLDSEPVLVRTDLSWCFVATRELYEKNGDAQILFHYDLDDYHALKFFFFLTDVDLSSGPHVCIRGSHRQKKFWHRLSWLIGRSDKELIDYYGAENLITICGEAGFGFAEDTFCYHRGTPPSDRDRLMLQIEFALNDYGMWINQ
jgi:hypothetical protein